jgi:adenylate cyclase class IV
MNTIEIEVKSLLGSSGNAQKLLQRMKKQDPSLFLVETSSQLNHYFIDGSLEKLKGSIQNQLTHAEDERNQIQTVVEAAAPFSVRTRKHNNTVLLIVKSTIDDTTSENGTARIEIEIPTPELSLEELDNLVLNSGFSYQAKWSRYREEYTYKSYSVCIDKNAGYGFLAEFESIVDKEDNVAHVKKALRNELAVLRIEELSQKRLEKMFTYYNNNWQEYYGTDNIFTIY